MQIELTNVGYVYQAGTRMAKTALENIDLALESGDCVSLIGHSGSGKSTLALILAGLYQPTSGKRTSYDMSQSGKSSSGVGFVFQYPEQQLFAETVYEEVAFGAKNIGVPQDYLSLRVEKSLTAVGLDPKEVWDRSPFSLSGGQQRRVCLASALALDPKLLILDEPTAGLDESGRLWLLDLVRKLHKDGRTILWVTHRMQEVAALVGRVVVLNHGRIWLEGSPAEVFRQEEKLAEAGLSIPQSAAVVRELRRRGLALPGEALTLDQAAQEIGDYLRDPALLSDEAEKEPPTEPVAPIEEQTEDPEEEPEISLESVLAAAQEGETAEARPEQGGGDV